MKSFDAFDPSFWTAVGVAFLCGAVIGFERQMRGKPAGIRTSILVCLGTTIFVGLGATVVTAGADSTRVLAQLVTGVGFLGAGVMFSREGIVSGVTTAAVIWMLAAIGAANGLGFHEAALAITLVTLAVLVGVEFLENMVGRLTRGIYRRDRN